METEGVKEKVMQYIQNNFLYGENTEDVGDNESLIGKGYIDSTGIIGLVAFIEKTFAIPVYDHEIIPENLDSIHNILVYISKKIEAIDSAKVRR